MAVDPVCGMTVDPNKTQFKALVGATTYYFCSSKCESQFLAAHKFDPMSHRM
ncbi:MAG TPA: YHS domain-containing protein [Conexivisphaerales archaeon]|nr:YHS domain-containing protein [Conexivisphaerales archaeon]